MALGAVTDVIEVTGEAPLVDVTSTVTGMTVEPDEFSGASAGRPRVDPDRAARAVDRSRATAASTRATRRARAWRRSAARRWPRTPTRSTASTSPTSATCSARPSCRSSSSRRCRSRPAATRPSTAAPPAAWSTWSPSRAPTPSTAAVSVYFEPESLQEHRAGHVGSRQHRGAFEVTRGQRLARRSDRPGQAVLLRLRPLRRTTDVHATPSASPTTVTSNDAPYYGGKVDWNITPSHRLEGTYLTDETEAGHRALRVRPRHAHSGRRSSEPAPRTAAATTTSASTPGILTENFLLSAQYGVNEFDRTEQLARGRLPLRLSTGASGTGDASAAG